MIRRLVRLLRPAPRTLDQITTDIIAATAANLKG